MRLMFSARGEGTYNVYHRFRLAGSVWSYGRLGWCAFDSRLRLVDGFFPTRDAAAIALVQQ
ncbi:MAG: hypothetical protein ACOYXR_08375 [Nitrospirota bacterium]